MAVDPLIEALKDEDSDIQARAAGALGDIGDERAVDPLIDALKDENSQVRSKVAWALGEIGDTRAFGLLTNLASADESEKVREAAMEALEKLG